jgi:hypothetical protein
MLHIIIIHYIKRTVPAEYGYEKSDPEVEVLVVHQKLPNLKGQSHEKACEIMIWDVNFGLN